MKKIATLLLIILLLLQAGCAASDPLPEPTPGSSIRSGSRAGFSWKLKGDTLVVSGEGTLDNLFETE